MVDEPTVRNAAGVGVGSRFGPYLLKRLLGRGGFGEVYEAEDTAMGRVVALKLLTASYSQNPVFRERLFREARTAGRLREAHVVPVHNCGEIDGQLFIDMRLIRGTDLGTVLERGGPLDPARAVAIVRQIASALDAAHAEQVIHRDVKPANVLLTSDDFACLVDFGLANAASDAKLTAAGTTIGTFAYMAPERLTDARVDHRADIYALACVLYKCLTGSRPYTAARGDLTAWIDAHLTAPIPRPSQQRAGIPAGFDEVIARGMAKNPDDRYPKAGDLAAAAHRALAPGQPTLDWTPRADSPSVGSTPTTAPWTAPQPPFPPIQSPRRRQPGRRTLIALAAFAAVAVIAGVVASTVVRRPAHTQHAITIPRPSSTTPTTLPFPKLNEPIGVAVDTAGNVYVSEWGGGGRPGRVLKLSAGETGPAELPFGDIRPSFIAVDAAGNLYVADYRGQRVWKLVPGAHGPSPTPFEHLGMPKGVAVDTAGNLYVSDGLLNQVLEVPAGATKPIQLMPTTLLDGPWGVAVDGTGNVYVADRLNSRVLKLAAGASEPIPLPFTGLNKPLGVAIDKAGNLYVTDGLNSRVLKLAPGATTASQLPLTGLKAPIGVAIDKDGNIYVVDCELLPNEQCVNGRVLELGAG